MVDMHSVELYLCPMESPPTFEWR